MMRNKIATYVLAVFSVLCIVGSCFVYLVPIEHDVGASLNPDGSISYRITGFTPTVYSYMVLEGVHTYDSVLFYHDDDYPAYRTSDSEVISFYSTLERLLSSRGFDSIYDVDAVGLKTALTHTSEAYSTAIFIATGVLPDTVQDEVGYPLLESWLAAGGTMYWMMGNPCEYYSTPDGIRPYGFGMFDPDLFKDYVSDKGATTCTDIAADMGFGYCSIDGAIRKDAPDSTPIGLTDDTYSSLSVIDSPYGGQVYIFGGPPKSLSFEHISALADYIVCGITADTVVLSVQYGEKGYGDLSAILSPIGRGDLLYLRVGKPSANAGATVPL